nr:hypothetical protein [Edwardsiella ictaluri]
MEGRYIALEGLEKRFDGLDRPAVANLTIRIASGAVMGLVWAGWRRKNHADAHPGRAAEARCRARQRRQLDPSVRIASCTPFWAIYRKSLACMKI